MRLLGNRWLLMVVVAVVFAAASYAFAPSVARLSVPQPAAGADALLTAGTPAGKSYTDGVIESMQARVAAGSQDYIALSQLGMAYLQKARETNDPSFYTQADTALRK